MTLTIVIGNKNYSSWSLRPWLVLRATGAPFAEIRIPLRQPDTRARIMEHSPAGKVPVLKDGGLAVWDSLAICEYLAEKFPAARLWPEAAATRAVARAVSAEMHSGFAALRRDLPMDIRGRVARPWSEDAAADIARVQQIWRDCRAAYGRGGRFLFGGFGIADAMFAPVVTRFRTYGVPVDGAIADYMEAVFDFGPMKEWCQASEAEPERLDQ